LTSHGAKRGNFRLSSNPIIDLGDRLASLDTFEAQKTYLEKSLIERFGGETYVWLTKPQKPNAVSYSLDELPFNLNDFQFTNIKDQPPYHLLELNSKYWAILPLARGENDFGRIIIQCEHPFDTESLAALADVSKIASLSIYATLQAQLKNWRQRQLALVQSVAAKISRITDLNILTLQITELVQQTFDYHYVAIFLISEDTGRLHFKSSAVSDESERPDFEKQTHLGFALGEHIIGYVAMTGRELIANDVTKEPRYKEVDSLAQTKSEVVLPLQIDNDIFGVFDIQSDEKDAFDEDDLVVLRALADSIALAIESTRLYQGVQSRADQLAAVSEVSRAITSILDTDELINRIVSLIHTRFDFPYVHLYTISQPQKKIVFKAGSGKRTPLYSDARVTYDIDDETGILPWVVQNGKTKRTNNVSQEPLFRKSLYSQQISGSEMAIPLIFGGETLGVLDIQSDRVNAFSQNDQQLMETLADNIAITIRNSNLYRSERWRRQIAESLRDVARVLSENSTLKEVFEAILVQLHKNLPCDFAGIWLFDSDLPDETPLDARSLSLAANKTSEDFPAEWIGQIKIIPDGWIKDALINNQPTIRQPNAPSGPIAEIYNLPPEYSAIAAPLSTGQEILGMLMLVHHTAGRYGLETEKITSAFGSYAAIGIENARLFEESQEQAWISTILLQVAQATQSLTDLNELVSTIVRLTPMIVGVKGCALFLREPDSEIFSLYAMYGISEASEEMQLEQPLPLPHAPILEELLLTHEPLKVRDVTADFNLPDQFTRQITADSLILLPLSSRNEMLGAFLLVNDSENTDPDSQRNVFNEDRLRIIQGIIQQTAVAVENIRLLEAKQEEAYISNVLLQVAQATVTSSNLYDALEAIVHIMAILVGIESSVIYLFNEKDDSFQTAHATSKNMTDDDLTGTSYEPGDFPMLDAIFQRNQPNVYPFIETTLPPDDWDLVIPDEGQVDPTRVLQSHYPLLMGFPLSVKEEVFGVLIAQDKNISTNRERRFELLWGIAQQVSLAIQNDKLNTEMMDRQRLEREFQLAREIQQTFLPNQKPTIPGWAMDVHWEPARLVGGDFYDYFLLPDGNLAFVIADVSDKGLAASLYMTVTRTLLRAAALEYKSPAKTLERVNDLLLMNSQNGLFVTTFYGVLSLSDGLLTYTIAGHNPPMIIRHQTGQVEVLSKGGMALGALPNIKLEEVQVSIDSGDCLVLYTDGVTEAFNAEDQMYGDDRLITVLTDNIGQTAHTVIEALKSDLMTFRADAPLSDDTSILAICREPSLTD